MRKWVIEDHLCRKCGGRILRCVEGAGMTPGGNPLRRCADCGASTAGIFPNELCWCGMQQKFQGFPAYCCLPYSILNEHPNLLEAFKKCGCDPERGGEVGIILAADRRTIIERGQHGS